MSRNLDHFGQNDHAGTHPGVTFAAARAEVASEVRPLVSAADLVACVRLQQLTWGPGYRDTVPASVLKVSQKVGGLAAGAFAVDGELLGFVYGLTGLDPQGRIVHWSHMLAVHPAWRDHGIGRRLKQYQREYLRELGVEVMHWSFDPLVARNAHLNVNVLGARLVEYVPDMYADTGSDLHTFGTDRWVAEWPVSPLAGALPEAVAGHRQAPVWSGHSDGAGGNGGSHGEVDAPPPVVRVEIPLDAETAGPTALPELLGWRQRTRAAFLCLLGRGYGVRSFYRDAGRCFYVLTRSSS